MSDPIRTINSVGEITAAAQQLREQAVSSHLTVAEIIAVLERWGAALRGPALEAIPGLPFLRLWLRRSSLESILLRELGTWALNGEWRHEPHARLGAFPLGVVGHWPAGNIEIQPLLSMSCALLGRNVCLVRVPTGLVEATRVIMEKLEAVDTTGLLTNRISLMAFDHERIDLLQAMAAVVDGAMIWGGAEAVSQVRSLSFPHWARVAVFGPRLSVAAMDAQSWSSEADQAVWCQRIARDVWQFDQQACSSPQALFLQRRDGYDAEDFVRALRHAFEEENRIHPRYNIHPALSSAICLTRASWLLEDETNEAVFPMSPDWTILVGAGTDIPKPTQGRTLSVLFVENLLDPIAKFDGTVQTLGLAVNDATQEAILAQAAARHGVDRIVKLGRMHVFGSPWDGVDLVKPMMRLVRHMPSHEF
jgi:Acyl-CoA reductase (LuxC)